MNEFNKSLELAKVLWESDYESRCQHFSFVFYKGRILAIGRNKIRTHPANLKNPIHFNGKLFQFKGICSELSAALIVKNKTNIPFSKLSIVNVRLDKTLKVKMSRPCVSCQNLISYLKPRKLFYTNDLGGFQSYF